MQKYLRNSLAAPWACLEVHHASPISKLDFKGAEGVEEDGSEVKGYFL
jgi:hypothetical protein